MLGWNLRPLAQEPNAFLSVFVSQQQRALLSPWLSRSQGPCCTELEFNCVELNCAHVTPEFQALSHLIV